MFARLLAAAVLGVGCIGAALAGPTLPQPFSAEYALRAGSLTVARSELSLTPTGDGSFVYELRVGLVGIAALFRQDRTVERSEWRYHEGDQLRPLVYRYERTGEEPASTAVTFDWPNGIARNTIRGRTETVRLAEGALDKLSYLLVLMQDLQEGKREVRYRVVAGGALETYHLAAVGQERLDTALGPLDTVKVQRLGPDGELATTFWCAGELHFLPVKIVHREEDGRVVSMFIRRLDGLGSSGPPRNATRTARP